MYPPAQRTSARFGSRPGTRRRASRSRSASRSNRGPSSARVSSMPWTRGSSMEGNPRAIAASEVAVAATAMSWRLGRRSRERRQGLLDASSELIAVVGGDRVRPHEPLGQAHRADVDARPERGRARGSAADHLRGPAADVDCDQRLPQGAEVLLDRSEDQLGLAVTGDDSELHARGAHARLRRRLRRSGRPGPRWSRPRRCARRPMNAPPPRSARSPATVRAIAWGERTPRSVHPLAQAGDLPALEQRRPPSGPIPLSHCEQHGVGSDVEGCEARHAVDVTPWGIRVTSVLEGTDTRVRTPPPGLGGRRARIQSFRPLGDGPRNALARPPNLFTHGVNTWLPSSIGSSFPVWRPRSRCPAVSRAP